MKQINLGIVAVRLEMFIDNNRKTWLSQTAGEQKIHDFYRYIETFLVKLWMTGLWILPYYHHSLHQRAAPLTHSIDSICISPTIRFDHFSIEQDVKFL